MLKKIDAYPVGRVVLCRWDFLSRRAGAPAGGGIRMTADQESRSPLETEPVQKLIVRYAIPTALTLMVNCLYNIVDQIFVGQGVGITAMAGPSTWRSRWSFW